VPYEPDQVVIFYQQDQGRLQHINDGASVSKGEGFCSLFQELRGIGLCSVLRPRQHSIGYMGDLEGRLLIVELISSAN